MNNSDYARFARNEYSQFGEDGIIERIMETIPEKDKWCVEFGAWDGVHLSNTYSMIRNKGYHSVLIEADKKKFGELQKNMEAYDAVLVNEFVTFDGENRLDNILAKTEIPKNFDFLSIDIDGNDYWILDSLLEYRPKVICIEYNPSIPNEIEYVQARDFSVQRGASALSICNLARQKSYELVATTLCNLIFVEKTLFGLFLIDDNRLPVLRNDSDVRVFAFIGYDGSIIHTGPIKLIWHDFACQPEELQCLPAILRTFPPNFSAGQKALFGLFMLFREPGSILQRIRNLLRRKLDRKRA